MTPECPKCESTSTRRRTRTKTLGHNLMFFLGKYPWECLTCQKRFFSTERSSNTKRHPLGEVYLGGERPPRVKPGSEESHSQ
jgi:hypothetical protein